LGWGREDFDRFGFLVGDVYVFFFFENGKPQNESCILNFASVNVESVTHFEPTIK